MAPAAEIAASLDGVVKRYGPNTALDGVHLNIERGKVTALLGANGAGIHCLETHAECLRLVRAPAFSARVLGFPLLFTCSSASLLGRGRLARQKGWR
jgi:ABC-2 type transport system ATP-binding protein